MLEILKYVTSDFWIFIGSLSFTVSVTFALGWSMNAILIGFRGKKCDNVKIG